MAQAQSPATTSSVGSVRLLNTHGAISANGADSAKSADGAETATNGRARRKILIARDFHPPTGDPAATMVASVAELRSQGLSGFLKHHFLRYHEAGVLVESLGASQLSLKTSLALRLLSRDEAYFEDPAGQRVNVTWPLFLKLSWRMARDRIMTRALLRNVEREVAHLERRIAGEPLQRVVLAPGARRGSPVYLRTDLVFGLRAGGSVGHIAGVLNHLDHFFGPPLFLSTDRIPTVAERIATEVVASDERFLNCWELAGLHYNETFRRRAVERLDRQPPVFIYQRYSGNNYCGIVLSRRYACPLVTEYNGSETWVARHWGHPRKYEPLTERIEMLNVRAADLVVVVSRVMRDELIERGIAAEKILVNPNGVDPDRYAPQIDGREVREQYGLQNKIVLGFIGTFGRWHGAEVLAEAFGRLIKADPQLRDRVRLMLIGDGNQMPEVRRRLQEHGVMDQAVLTGVVPQEDGPRHLAACDVLVSPHVPNPDGTPFFGSPTKLFEYMAMGRGIVASSLDQIGEVLEHNRNAWLVEPGNVGALVAGLRTLVDDAALRQRLGQAARTDAVGKHSWRQHTARIAARLHELCVPRQRAAA